MKIKLINKFTQMQQAAAVYVDTVWHHKPLIQFGIFCPRIILLFDRDRFVIYFWMNEYGNIFLTYLTVKYFNMIISKSQAMGLCSHI